MQAPGCWARSCANHCSCSPPATHDTFAQFELSAMRCQEPTSKLYQPFPATPAAAPKYEKYAAAPEPQSVPPEVSYSWFPTAGWLMALTAAAPHAGSYD